MTCLLCGSINTNSILEKNDADLGVRKYVECGNCCLVFLKPKYFLTKIEEKKRYDHHENSPEDKNYVRFLQRLTDPLLGKIKPGAAGLDYGCGPGPAISFILGRHGIDVKNYDPIYFRDESLLGGSYDFVTCSEVVEHFFKPKEEFIKLKSLIKRGGILGIMTQFRRKEDSFEEWWYHKDPTHVCFYNHETFLWLGGWLGLKTEFPAKNIVIYTN